MIFDPEEIAKEVLAYIEPGTHSRDGLRETPKRMAKAWDEMFAGYAMNPHDVVKVFDEPCSELVLCQDIEFYSTCEHHLLPFFGKAHIAYIPDGKVIGLSKMPRILDIYAKRLQIQERLCQQVTAALEDVLHPKGAACVIEARHFCMMMRGVAKQNSVVTTSSLTGVFMKDATTRAELFSLIRR